MGLRATGWLVHPSKSTSTWDTTKQRHETGLPLMLACRHQARGTTGPPSLPPAWVRRSFTAASQREHCMWEAAEGSLLLPTERDAPLVHQDITVTLLSKLAFFAL